MKIRMIVTGALFVGALLAFCGYRLRTGRIAHPAPIGAKGIPHEQQDLRQFMQSKVHQEYTFLSFTIWHDRPLTPAKMDAIAASSSRVMDLSKELGAYGALYKEQGWSAEDLRLFEENRLQLSRVAEGLNRAAQKRASPDILNSFEHLGNTCQSCHQRFRPDLRWL